MWPCGSTYLLEKMGVADRVENSEEALAQFVVLATWLHLYTTFEFEAGMKSSDAGCFGQISTNTCKDMEKVSQGTLEVGSITNLSLHEHHNFPVCVINHSLLTVAMARMLHVIHTDVDVKRGSLRGEYVCHPCSAKITTL